MGNASPSNHETVPDVSVCDIFILKCNVFVVCIADCAIPDMHEYRCGESCKS